MTIHLKLWLALLLVAGVAASSSCSSSNEQPPGFDDHTVPRIDDIEAFEQLATETSQLSAVKFTITAFSDPAACSIVYYDNQFYSLHDEWYWFRLLNGQPVSGDEETEPVEDLELESIEAAYTWAKQQQELPLDLALFEDRLYSRRFYELGMDARPKRFGLGTLLHVPALSTESAKRPELWAFQLEYADGIVYDEIVTFFEALRATLPPEIGDQLRWVVRSPVQEELARTMEANKVPYHDRILRYSEISVPGAVEVYNPGLTAGRVHIVKPGEELTSADDHILVLDSPPDWLPPASAMITAVPQTPLAHINLLARNRGIPNLYLGDALNHVELRQLGSVRAPAIISATEPDKLTILAMTEAQFFKWQRLRSKPVAVVPQVDPNSVPYLAQLADYDFADADTVRSFIGGKATGFLALAAGAASESGETALPDRPMVLTIRSYVEHLASLRPAIEQMLGDFVHVDPSLRLLVLEGRAAFDASYRSARDQAVADRFLAACPAGDPVGDLVRAGGLVTAIRNKPLDSATLAEISSGLEQHFATFGDTQGLRFRSSSTVEDIEGFNGAGLYESNTGFLRPELQEKSKDQKKSIAWAIKKTWSSYWGFAAFEERRRERIDHLSGAMAVLIHARFDDDKELANGVFTFTRMPPDSDGQSVDVMELNVQQGAVSVTNPDPASGELPEQTRVKGSGGSIKIERLRSSTLSPNVPLLDDNQLRAIFTRARAVAGAWLTNANTGVPAVQQQRAVVLDFEFRWMEAGWPELVAGQPASPRRMVLKQVRSLDPGTRNLDPRSVVQPLPREILSRARRIELRQCSADRFQLAALEALTDAALKPDVGHAVIPFVGMVRLQLTADIPEIGRQAGDVIPLYHPSFTAVTPVAPGASWGVSIERRAEDGQALTKLSFEADGSYTLQWGTETIYGTSGACTSELLHSSPSEYLRSLLAASERGGD